MDSSPLADAQLVSAALAGRRDAFESIVRRYQRLVCSVAYSAVGDVGASEDIAQETFLAAWKGLPELKEPEKLRGWLCGIARRRSLNSRRNARTEPTSTGAPICANTPGAGESPADSASRRDEADLVWRALASVPELYREPLVLYYRENRSVEAVAEALDLSQDAVKQRLARGREQLKAEVTSLVEGALRGSGPGSSFAPAVMAALPAVSLSAKAAAGGSVLAKAASSFVLLGGPLTGVAAGFAGAYLGYKQSEKASRSDEERFLLRRMYRVNVIGMAALLAAVGLFILLARHSRTPGWLELTIVPAVVLISLSVTTVMAVRTYRQLRALARAGVPVGQAVTEFRSRAELWGQPLVHARFGSSMDEGCQPVRAWIAMGNIAVGRLFAYGGIAVAPIAAGGVAVGGLAVGGLSLALIAVGGCALGGLAVGGQGIGWISIAGCALAYRAAYGGIGIASDFALAPTAHAAHANDAAARSFFQEGLLGVVCEHLPYLGWISVIGIVPMVVWWFAHRSDRRKARS